MHCCSIARPARRGWRAGCPAVAVRWVTARAALAPPARWLPVAGFDSGRRSGGLAGFLGSLGFEMLAPRHAGTALV